ncbi:MAG: MFS transporter, partial [Alistipes sp.]|nr:MFS transporter [Alistipes sp.]
YGGAFDFFNIPGSLFVNKETDTTIRSSAQGLFMIMTNGIGATIGTLGAQAVVDKLVYSQPTIAEQTAGWSASWLVFAGYALCVAIVFALVFKYKHDPEAIGTIEH